MDFGVSIFALVAIWLLPFITVLFSSRVSGSENFAWLLGIVFVSWFAWIFFLLLAPVKSETA